MDGESFHDVALPLGVNSISDGRAATAGDLNSDGQIDLVIANNGGPPTIYLNRYRNAGNWVAITLVGTSCNRDAIGAAVRVSVEVGGVERTIERYLSAGSGYASESLSDVHVGLGAAATITRIEVVWPGKATETFQYENLSSLVNTRFRLVQGESRIELVRDFRVHD